MKIAHAYQVARGMTATRLNQAFTTFYRGLFNLEFKRQQREDDALAALRSLGDYDGTHLRQAVTLAVVGVDDAALEEFLARYMNRGQDDPNPYRSEP